MRFHIIFTILLVAFAALTNAQDIGSEAEPVVQQVEEVKETIPDISEHASFEHSSEE